MTDPEHGADLMLADLCRIDVVEGGRGEPAPRPLADITWVSRQLADKRPALFLDYDGTLTPIVERPEDARLSTNKRQTLRDAARAMPVAVVSGRDLADVRKLVGIPEIISAGSHGFDIEGPDLRLELPEGVDALDDLDEAAEGLTKHLAPITGARLERKRFAIAVHYRRVADEDVERVQAAIDVVLARCSRLRKNGGKQVFELRPDIEWDKGRAIRWLLSQLGLDSPDVQPIYIGDYLTDEDAFRALQGLGLGILVADHLQLSSAAFRVQNTKQVAAMLQRLVQTETLDE